MTQTPAAPSISMPEPYRTSDTPFAAFLHYSGHKLIGTRQDPNNLKREVMVFIYTPEIAKLEQIWNFGKAEGLLKDYHRSLKVMNRAVNEARKER